MRNQATKNQNLKNITNKNKTSRQNQNGGRPDELWICGKHPIFTALKQKRRKIFEILTTKNTLLELDNFLKTNSLQSLSSITKIVESVQIENFLGPNQLHQGLAARVSRLPIQNQNDLLEELYDIKQNSTLENGNLQNLPTLLLLDQISDPHNVGAIIRSAAAFGVKKIIFCEHNSPKENATIAKTSAGNIEFVDFVIVTNFSNLIEKLKKIGYWCFGLAGEGTEEISSIKKHKNIALVIGSEGDGIRSLIKKNCDFLVKIKTNPNVESLNASVAASIALYEISSSK